MALPVETSSYDVAVMALVIYFVPDPAKSIAEMRRVVRPGGTVCTYMWDGPAGGSPTFPMQQALLSLGHSPTVPPSFTASTMESLQGLWRAGGLLDVRARTIEVRRTYDNFDACWAAMSLQPIARPIIARMDEAERAALQARLREVLPAPDAQGRWSYGARANAITGRVPS
jgi:SAM-dependent methyltransferase